MGCTFGITGQKQVERAAKRLSELSWLGIEDGLRNFLSSVECLEMGRMVGSLS